MSRALLTFAGALALSACSGAEDAWFREESRARGLDWVHDRGPTRYWFPEIMGGGVGLLDYDGDGALDVYLVQSGDLAAPGPRGANQLFRNDGRAHFENVTASAGGADTGYGMGCAIADADQDGDPDVYVTNVGPNALLLDEGGRFEDATEPSGTGDAGWGTSAAWADTDADGDLDLYLANYVRWWSARELVCRSPQGEQDYCSPLNYDAPSRDVLYRNEGGARFTDVSVSAGLGERFGNGLGVVAADYDQDGRIDFYVANDQMPNQLWHNGGDGTFTDRALLAGCAVNRGGSAEAGMGVLAVDLEEDGDLDLFVTHLRDETNTCYRNQGGLFSDQTALLGLGAPSLPFTGFGTGAQDFDRDGVLDLFVANGAVTRNRVRHDPADPYAEPNQLFQGLLAPEGKLRFVERPRGGMAAPLAGNSRGAAFGDLDEDGACDVVVVDNGGHVELLLNLLGDAAAGGHWIGLCALERSGAPAEGARLTIEAGGRTRQRWVSSGGSYASSNDPRLLLGLGSTAEAPTVRVRWVDGTEERFGPLAIDRKHTLARGRGAAAER